MGRTTFDKILRGPTLIKALGITALTLLLLVNIAGASPFAYITEFNSVAVIDTATDKITTTILTGEMNDKFGEMQDFKGVAVTPDGTKVYAAGDYGVFVIDAATNKFLKIPISDDSNDLYTDHSYLAGVAINPSGTKAYVLLGHNPWYPYWDDNLLPGWVYVIDIKTNKVTNKIKIGGNLPTGIAVDPNGLTLAVTSSDRRFSLINLQTNKIEYTLDLESEFLDFGYQNIYPIGITYSPDRQHLYIVNKGNNNVLDFYKRKFINVGNRPKAIAVTPDSRKAYVTNSGDNTVSVIDTTTNTVIATVPVGNGPYGVAVTPDGKKVYVVNKMGAVDPGNTVSVINTSTNTVIDTVNGLLGPVAFGQFIGPAAPTADFSASPKSGKAPLTVKFTDKSMGPIVSRKWLFGDGASSTDKNPTHVYKKSGSYNVLLKVTNGGGSNALIKNNYITIQQAKK